MEDSIGGETVKGRIMALSVGEPKGFTWKGKEELSGIGKLEVQEVLLTKEGFKGDRVANLDFHGGRDRAVCVYPFEHYKQWEKEFKTEFQPPAVGENLCLMNMLEKDVYIGDIFSIGDVVVQVTQGRIPCSTISKFNRIDSFLNRIVETCYTGYFFRVLNEGVVYWDSKIELMDRIQERISVYDATYVMFHDPKNEKVIQEILQINELALVWKEKFRNMLEKIK